MKTELLYRLLLHDEKGRLVKDSGLMPSHSYVIQFLEMLRGWFVGTDTDATDVNNAETGIYRGARADYNDQVDAAALTDLYGIVVGTNAGGSPESNTDYKLDTKILHSATGEAGKLNYRAVTLVKARVVGANVDFDISRPFINESGATITVKEIGIIVRTNVGSVAFPDYRYHLLLRDVVADFGVLNGYTLTVVYTLRTTV